MPLDQLLILAAAFFAVAALYSTVGHAGASGYLATMALVGLAPATMRPTALVLNVVVATLATVRFARAGRIAWRAWWPFVLGSLPAAFIGGRIQLPVPGYKLLVALVLLASAAILVHRAWRAPASEPPESPPRVPIAVAILCGGAIGILSGLTGTGGGIFLSPLLLFAGWAGPRATAGLAAPFILANSLSGLLGVASTASEIPAEIGWLGLAVLAGGMVGTTLGLSRLPARGLLAVLAVVLAIAGGKLLLP